MDFIVFVKCCVSLLGEYEINVYDKYVMKQLKRIRHLLSGRVIYVCMGPEKVKDTLRKCFAFGADEVILISDKRLIGADTYETSYILSCIARQYNCDYIVCGQKSTDGETGQIPFQIAAREGSYCINNVKQLNIVNGEIFAEIELMNKKIELKVERGSILVFNDFCVEAPVTLQMLKLEKKGNVSIKNLDDLFDRELILESKTKVLETKRRIIRNSVENIVIYDSDEGRDKILQQIEIARGRI